MENGAMIASAEGLTDCAEGAFRHLARKEHGDLTREGNIFRPAFARHIGQANIEVLGHFLLDDFDADGEAAFFVENFAQQTFDDLDAELLAGERSI